MFRFFRNRFVTSTPAAHRMRTASGARLAVTGGAQGHQEQIVPAHPAAPEGEDIVRGKLAVRCEVQVLQQ